MYKRELKLSDREREDLQHIRDRDQRPYMRERAAALLKIASGICPHRVASSGLLKRRKPKTVYRWLNRYEEHRQLTPRPASRRAFSP